MVRSDFDARLQGVHLGSSRVPSYEGVQSQETRVLVDQGTFGRTACRRD